MKDFLTILRDFFLGSSVDEFDRRIFEYSIDNLPVDLSVILREQLELFNRVHRYYKNEDQSNEVYVSQFYWYAFFKNRLDYPKLFDVKEKESKLCGFDVILPSSEVLKISIWVVLGVACYYEVESKSKMYRPLSPGFDIENWSCGFN